MAGMKYKRDILYTCLCCSTAGIFNDHASKSKHAVEREIAEELTYWEDEVKDA